MCPRESEDPGWEEQEHYVVKQRKLISSLDADHPLAFCYFFICNIVIRQDLWKTFTLIIISEFPPKKRM
jgi:hypothetical protein